MSVSLRQKYAPAVAAQKARQEFSRPSSRDTTDQDLYRALIRLANAVIRGAAAGFCLRGGLNLVSLLFALVVKARRKPRANLLDQLRDTFQYTAFLGSFSGLYVAVDEGLAATLGKRRTAGWRAFAAGAAAGPSILLTGSRTRHTSLALYILLRGITLLVRCGNKPQSPKLLRQALAPTRFKHGDTLLMCLSSSQILYSWIMQPHTLPAAYVKFLNRHGGKPAYCAKAIRELALNNMFGLPQKTLVSLKGTQHAQFHDKIPCGFLHPGISCNEHFLRFLPRSYCRSLPVYLPVYLLPGILVHRQNLVKGDAALGIWRRLGLGAARSSLFLTLYCAMAWRGACLAHQVTGYSTGLTIATACLTAGLATLVEKKSRRMELALYCLSRAVESCALCLPGWGLHVPPRLLPARLDVVLFSAATAAIMHCYSDSHGRQRDVFRSKYLNVLDFIFGSTGHEHGAILHHPSTSELLELLEERLPIDTRALRLRAASLLVLPDLDGEREQPGTPRTSFSDPGITSFPSTTDEEYQLATEPSASELD